MQGLFRCCLWAGEVLLKGGVIEGRGGGLVRLLKGCWGVVTTFCGVLWG